jgi:hypothetical protein
MANYLIVVPRGNAELLDLLSVAFRGHTGFHVVVDRRLGGGREDAPAAESDRLALGHDEIVVAERADRVERSDLPLTGASGTVVARRVPVRRRRTRRSFPRAHAAAVSAC